MTQQLSPKQRQFLRALAHPLKPIVQVGNKGVTEALLTQIDEQLRAHELLKVRFNTETETEPEAAIPAVTAATQCQVVQHAGRILTLYRRHPSKPQIALPQ